MRVDDGPGEGAFGMDKISSVGDTSRFGVRLIVIHQLAQTGRQ